MRRTCSATLMSTRRMEGGKSSQKQKEDVHAPPPGHGCAAMLALSEHDRASAHGRVSQLAHTVCAQRKGGQAVQAAKAARRT